MAVPLPGYIKVWGVGVGGGAVHTVIHTTVII